MGKGRKRRAIGFYTDEKGRRRPITGRRGIRPKTIFPPSGEFNEAKTIKVLPLRDEKIGPIRVFNALDFPAVVTVFRDKKTRDLCVNIEAIEYPKA